jgi:hypothetical protein
MSGQLATQGTHRPPPCLYRSCHTAVPLPLASRGPFPPASRGPFPPAAPCCAAALPSAPQHRFLPGPPLATTSCSRVAATACRHRLTRLISRAAPRPHLSRTWSAPRPQHHRPSSPLRPPRPSRNSTIHARPATPRPAPARPPRSQLPPPRPRPFATPTSAPTRRAPYPPPRKTPHPARARPQAPHPHTTCPKPHAPAGHAYHRRLW